MTAYKKYSCCNSPSAEISLVLLEKSTGVGNRGDCLGSDIQIMGQCFRKILSPLFLLGASCHHFSLVFSQTICLEAPEAGVGESIHWKGHYKYPTPDLLMNGVLQRRLNYVVVTNFFNSQRFHTKKGFISHSRDLFTMDSEGGRGDLTHCGHSGGRSDGVWGNGNSCTRTHIHISPTKISCVHASH